MSTDGGPFPTPDVPDRLVELSRTSIPGALPEAVKRSLVAAGLMDPNTGATRRARARYCEGCKQPVYRGIDRPYGGMSIDLDPTPISAEGELLAVWTKRRTYQMRWDAKHGHEFDRRDPEQITGYPVGTPGIDVMVQHKCFAEPIGHEVESMLKDRPRANVNLVDPPY